MITYYRISDGSYNKERFPFATKEACLKNFRESFAPLSVHVICDNVKDETFDMVNKYFGPEIYPGYSVERTNFGNGAASWRHAAQLAMNQQRHKNVYFLEDDYIHKSTPDPLMLIMDGLQVADYVSLYDHPDKYLNGTEGGNPFVENGGEVTRVVRTHSSHWKLTNSTTMTFATSVDILKEDWPVWDKNTSGTHPNDFGAFYELMHKPRTLITPIPGVSTHAEIKWASPGINWENVINKSE